MPGPGVMVAMFFVALVIYGGEAIHRGLHKLKAASAKAGAAIVHTVKKLPHLEDERWTPKS